MAERRRTDRRRCLLGARAVFNARSSTLSCTVRNFSEEGALLRFGEHPYMPDEIEIVLDNRRTLMPVQVVWRGANTAGVVFPRGRFLSELKEDAARDLEAMKLPPAGTVVH